MKKGIETTKTNIKAKNEERKNVISLQSDFLQHITMKVIIWLFSFFNMISGLRIFLMGGNVNDNETTIYESLAKATNKTPQPNRCSDDWDETKCPRIGVVTSAAPSEADGNDAYMNDLPTSLSYKNLFGKYGFSPKHISVHIDNYQTDTDLSTQAGKRNFNIINQADVIFFNGGDQARHARCWLQDNTSPNPLFLAILARKSKVILSGTSAGTMIMSNPFYGQGISYGHLYFSKKEGLAYKQIKDGGVNGTGLSDVRNGTSGLQYDDNGGYMIGFGLVDFLLDTHFDARGRLGRIVSAMYQMKKKIGVGIDQSTCLFYEDGKATVLGKGGVFIVDLSRAIEKSRLFFAAERVRASYLTIGDTYYFGNDSVESGKQLIQQPYYSGYTDSHDILSDYQSSLLMTRLVDQTGKYNVGTSRTPSGYPSSAPTFKLTFYKDSSTLGYKDPQTKKYTAKNIWVDYSYQ